MKKISVVTACWYAEDWLEVLIDSVFKNAKNPKDIEIVAVDSSKSLKKEDTDNVKIIRPEEKLRHGDGLDLGIRKASYDTILVLDVDAHIVMKDWDLHIPDFTSEIKLYCACDARKLKPARPLAMFFNRRTFIDNDISFRPRKLEGVKFDVGVHAYFRVLTEYGDKSVICMPYQKTEYEDVFGTEYRLDGKRFVYHNWYGTRFYNGKGERAYEKVDSLDWETFKTKKDNLFEQYNKSRNKVTL